MNTEEKKEPASILRERTKVVKTVRRKPNKGEGGRDLFVETVKVSKVIDLNPDKKKEYREIRGKISDIMMTSLFSVNLKTEDVIKELAEKQKEIDAIQAKCRNKFIDEAHSKVTELCCQLHNFIEDNINDFERLKKLLEDIGKK